jgi:hypothetical protein
MQTILRMEAVVDMDAASDTTASTFKAPTAGYLMPSAIFGRFEEAVAAGGFTTTAGVAAIYVGTTEVASWSSLVGALCLAKAIGDTALVTPAAAYTEAPIKFAAGDAITVKTKTQGVGGTVTGTVRFWIPVEFGL